MEADSNIKTLLACIFFAVIVITSCNQHPRSVVDTMETSSHKREFLKLLNHFQNDKLKLQACYFLIQNIRYNYHFQGKGVNTYRNIFPSVLSLPRDIPLRRAWDSIRKDIGPGFPGAVYQVRDNEYLTADILIKHVDAAFRAWEYPWAKDLSFSDFCKYLLPYKLLNEQPEYWNGPLQESNKWLVDSMRSSNDPYIACKILNKHLKGLFRFDTFPVSWDLSCSDLQMISAGSCYQATQYGAYHMRAMGIPVVIDFTPFWGNMNGGHEWNALIWNEKPIPFVAAESDPGLTKIDLAFQRKRGKVYRHTPVISEGAKERVENPDRVPLFLKDPYVEDVTSSYLPVSNLTVKLNKAFPDAKRIYLCVFNRQIWSPLCVKTINQGDSEVTFKDLGRDIVYLPMYYEPGLFVPAGNPVLLDSNGNSTMFNKQAGKRQSTFFLITKKGPAGPAIKASSKYDLMIWNDGWEKFDTLEPKSDSIWLHHLPPKALYWLHSKEKTGNERIFTFKNGKQQWF